MSFPGRLLPAPAVGCAPGCWVGLAAPYCASHLPVRTCVIFSRVSLVFGKVSGMCSWLTVGSAVDWNSGQGLGADGTGITAHAAVLLGDSAWPVSQNS